MFSKKERFLGIDIGPSAVRLVELSGAGHHRQVEAYALEALPEGAVQDRHPKEIEIVAAALKRAHRQSGSRLRQGAVAVPTSSVITRTITLPIQYSETEIEAIIETEVAQYVPYPVEEVYLDFEVQGASKTVRDSQDVMVVATRREYVDVRQAVLEEAGLKAAIVDVEAYAIENVFGELSRYLYFADTEDEDVSARLANLRTALVDVGASATTLYVFEGELMAFHREQPIGCEQLTQQLIGTYGMTRDQVEQNQRNGQLAENDPSQVLALFRQSIAEQIDNALQFFFSSSHYNAIDGMMLTGGGGLIPELNKTLSERVDIPVIVANPFETMACAKGVDATRLFTQSPLYTVACGLALRSLQ